MAIIDDISALYVAYFNRAPDAAGLNFWISRANGVGGPAMSLVEIANSFAVQTEATSLYSFLSAPNVGTPATFLSSVYLNLFGRVASAATDPAGFAYWSAQLSNPAVGAGRVLLDIRSGATGNDLLVINNKTAVGKAFVQQQIASSSAFNLDAAKAAFAGVTTDAASASTAIARNNLVFADLVAPIVVPDQTFSYLENNMAGAAIGTVSATDSGGSGVAGFRILTGNTDGFFAIDSKGVISLTATGAATAAISNDFEKSPHGFSLGIAANDLAGNVSAAATVIVRLTDVDDTAPALRGATASSTAIRLNFDETLKAVNVRSGAFSAIDATNTAITVNSVEISGAQITLTLAKVATGAVRISYTPPATGDVLQDVAGNRVEAVNITANAAQLSSPTNNLTLTFNDPTGTLVPFQSAIGKSVQAAWNLWAVHFTRTAPIEIEINFMPAAETVLAAARSLVIQSTDLFDQGKRILQVGAAYEIATGLDPNGSLPDGEISLGNNLSRFAFRASINDPLPQDKFDAISVFAHEIGHVLGFNAGGNIVGNFVSAYERHIVGASNPVFTGPNAVAANGGSLVLLDPVSPSHLADTTDLMAARLVNGQERLVEPLHIAILQDTGLPISVLGAGGLV